MAWIIAAGKQFICIGSKNVITYNDVFPLLKNNTIWLGPGFSGGNAYFRIAPEDARTFASGVYDEAAGLVKFRNVGWFTNIDHGGRHEPLILDTMAHNLKFNKKLRSKLTGKNGTCNYLFYENCDAIEIPFVECIPSDYDGIMGVPITFLDSYNPEQFEILGLSRDMDVPTKTGMPATFLSDYFAQGGTGSMQPGHPDLCYYDADGKAIVPYRRIMIRHKKGGNA